MSDTEQNDQVAERGASWLDKVSKPLIIVSVLAFGLVIVDRVENMRRADDLPDLPDLPEVVEIDRNAVEGAEVNELALASESADDVGNSVSTDEVSEIEALFGSRLVFVSESTNPYLVTADDRRIAIGDAVDDQSTLAEISQGRVIVDRSGDLLTFELPEPKVQ